MYHNQCELNGYVMNKPQRSDSILRSQSMFCAPKNKLSKESLKKNNTANRLSKAGCKLSSMEDDNWGWFVYEDQMKSASTISETQRVDVPIEEIEDIFQFDMD